MPLLVVGCVGFRSPAPERAMCPVDALPREYVIGCPDVLAVRFVDHPHLDCLVSVDLDGRLPISSTVRPEVERGTLKDAREAIADATGCEPSRVSVELAEARTGRIFLFGPEQNRQQMLPYQGPERLLDFLYRTESLRPGCTDLRDVFVLRPNVATGGRPQVFPADLAAMFNGDSTTNLMLEPGDQVYVGETRRSSFTRLLPDWMQTGYRRLVGVWPSDATR